MLEPTDITNYTQYKTFLYETKSPVGAVKLIVDFNDLDQ